MMMCKISNVTSMSIIIEDLGIRLQPSGGDGSHAVVREDIASRSIDLKRNSRWVKLDKFEIVSQSLQPSNQTVTPPVLDTSNKLVLESSNNQTENIGILQKIIEDMQSQQKEMFKLLQNVVQLSQSQVQATVPSPRFFSQVSQDQTPQPSFSAPSFGSSSFEEPLILPGSIVPKSVEVSVQTKEEEISGDDFDSSLKALRKAMKK